MSNESLSIKGNEDTYSLIESRAKIQLARNSYISDHRTVDDTDYYELGIISPKLIIGEDVSPLIKYINIDGVISFSSKKKGNNIEIDWPDRADLFINYEKKKNGLIWKAENALINSFGDKFLDIPKVQTGLNPIKEIILSVQRLGEIPICQLNSRMTKNRAESYIKFLETLDFITRDEIKIYPGNEINKYDLADLQIKEIRKNIISDIISNGFRYLRDELKIYILTPYLELSNAYYLQSHYAESVIAMTHDEISRHYSDMYHRTKKKQPFQVFANLIEISDAGIIENVGQSFKGYEDLLERFQQQLPAYV